MFCCCFKLQKSWNTKQDVIFATPAPRLHQLQVEEQAVFGRVEVQAGGARSQPSRPPASDPRLPLTLTQSSVQQASRLSPSFFVYDMVKPPGSSSALMNLYVANL